MRQHYPTLVLVASAEAGSTDAQDVVQAGVAIALTRLDTFEPGTDFRAWMSAIVRNAARNHRRGRRRGLRLTERFRETKRGQQASSTGPGDPSAAERDGELRDAVDALPDAQRACLLLRVVQEHSYAEIGKILDLPEATARSHVLRARRRVAEQMGAGDVDGGDHDE